MVRIPRQVHVQDRLDAVEDFKYAVSTDPDIIAERKAQRGQGLNILDDQLRGEMVGTRMLALHDDDPEVQAEWARILGGVMLNSAMYMFRDLDEKPMNRVFWIPELVTADGVVIDQEERATGTFQTLEQLRGETATYVDPDNERGRTPTAKRQLARFTGNTAMQLAIFGAEFKQGETQLEIALREKELILAMQDDILAMALDLKINPSLAQLGSEVTRLAALLRERSANGKLSPEIPAAHREATYEISHPHGF